jgi:hypothetical protein
MRQQLRRAAQEFADHLYDLLHAGLLAELRREHPSPPRVARGSARGSTPKPERTYGKPSPQALERVIVYVVEHPGTKPKAIIEDTGMRRPAVFAALNAACEMGALVKHGSWRHVTYSPAGHGPVSTTSVARAKSPKSKSRRMPTDPHLGEQVVAFIAAHPGCTRADLLAAFPVTLQALRRALEAARAGRRIRMEGTRRTARYSQTDVATSTH